MTDLDKTSFRLETDVSFVQLSNYIKEMGEQLNALAAKE